MFFHNFKYTFKIIFRNKVLIFWTFAFPLILVTLFNLAFSNIEKTEQLTVFEIGIVDNDKFKEDTVLKTTLEELSAEGENKIFNISYGTEEVLKEKLLNENIIGYLLITDESKIVVKENGIEQTVFSKVVDEINQTKLIINDIVNKQMLSGSQVDVSQIYQKVLNDLNDYQANIKDNSKDNLSYSMIEYYTVIAMTCLYGAMFGMLAINNNLPNMSKNGMRVSISPTKKIVTALSSSLASYLVQLIGISLLFLYTIFIIKVDYGANIFYIILLALIGCLAGCTFGTAIASFFKTSENNKIGIIISFTMVGSFLSGMMGITMKYVIDSNIPLLNKINPVNMITDGLYSLYYSGMNRYWFNIYSLLIFSAIMLIITIVVLRRQKYDSI